MAGSPPVITKYRGELVDEMSREALIDAVKTLGEMVGGRFAIPRQTAGIDKDAVGRALTGLQRGAKTLPTEISYDFTLRELVQDWFLMRYGPFGYEDEFQIGRILSNVAESLTKGAVT